MKQIYHPYYLWEDWKHGLFKKQTDNDEYYINKSKELLQNINELYDAMYYVAFNWRHSAEINLTNKSRNHQAWLGQAACLYSCDSPENITKQAWHLLTPEEQIEANKIADAIYDLWYRHGAIRGKGLHPSSCQCSGQRRRLLEASNEALGHFRYQLRI